MKNAHMEEKIVDEMKKFKKYWTFRTILYFLHNGIIIANLCHTREHRDFVAENNYERFHREKNFTDLRSTKNKKTSHKKIHCATRYRKESLLDFIAKKKLWNSEI
ncbi:hypothetical protein P5V15_009892 [Pogonomyrmex californicus]